MNRKYDTRIDALKSPEFKKLATSAIRAFGIENIALIGGLAVSHYANPPVTVDVDFLYLGTCGDAVEAAEEWYCHPWKIITMGFPKELPSHCIRMERSDLGQVIDILPTGLNPYLRSVVERAVEIEAQPGFKIPIARVEDIIVLKTIAGRDKDIEDNAALGVKLGGKIDRGYIRRVLSGMLK